ncbi:MAG: N-methyl-L-tryptophan oxidase [Isosphaeraceae bacterium]
METIEAPNVIIGAGAMGAAAAYHLARRGEPVLLVEQFAIGHDRGSSHGAARITRHSYADPRYARLMPAAFRAWRELEADAGESLYVRTGGVSFSPPGVDYAARVAASLAELDVPHWHGTGAEFNRIQPAFALPVDEDVVFEPDAGLLAASRAVTLQVELARRLGGGRTRVLERSPVRRIDLNRERPTIVTDEHRIVADRLIVAAGAWVAHLIPDLPTPVRVTRQQVLYFRPADSSPFQIGRFPVFIYKGGGEDEAFYGMPDFLGLGVKAARHGGPEVDPDANSPVIGEAYRSEVRRFLRGHIPALADAAIGFTEVCLYTVAPDEEFYIDFLPIRRDVLVASPCSGHGFKFSCLIGRVLADLATTGATELPVDHWRFNAANPR